MNIFASDSMRTHTCGELRSVDAGKEAVLCGWVDAVRVQGKVAFVDVRDRYGVTQCFIGPKLAEGIEHLKQESVVKVVGEVKERPQPNPDLKTGEVEVKASELVVLSAADPLPMQLGIDSTEETRLKYRYLDLRTSRMQRNLLLRSEMVSAFTEFLSKEGFAYIETPLLTKSTPEGARDYLVPSRVHNGKFFALPQSPQLLKQLLMVAGFDKYFQLARCLRDEDLRADRQPEFSQVDLEMSFVDEADVRLLVERAVQYVWRKVLGVELKLPFPVLSFRESMGRYGSDQPDLRQDKDDPKEFSFLWVVDFPMFEYDEGRWYAVHHPFTHPKDEDLEFIESDPGKVRAKAYDLVCNGFEVAGGSIRIFERDLQRRVFRAIGLSDEEASSKFDFLLEAFRYGVPPHGGCAFGFDRLAMIAAGEASIKEVIAFPKDKTSKDLLTGAPSVVSVQQLDDLGISVKK